MASSRALATMADLYFWSLMSPREFAATSQRSNSAGTQRAPRLISTGFHDMAGGGGSYVRGARSCFGRPLVRWVASHSCGGMVQPNLAASVSAMEWSARMCPSFSSFWRYDA